MSMAIHNYMKDIMRKSNLYFLNRSFRQRPLSLGSYSLVTGSACLFYFECLYILLFFSVNKNEFANKQRCHLNADNLRWQPHCLPTLIISLKLLLMQQHLSFVL